MPSGEALARATALIDIGRCADALPLLHQAIAEDPQNANARCLLSLALLRERRYGEAEEAARAAIAVAPQFSGGYALRALALRALQRRQEAMTSAQRGVELDPSNPDRYNVFVQVALGWRTDLARQAADTLVQLAPASAVAHYRAGTVPMVCEENAAAEACFRRALELDPVFAAANNDLGVVLLRQGKRTEALAAFQRAAEIDPGDQVAVRNIRNMGRHHKLPLPAWSRGPFALGPGLVVALYRKVRNRHELDGLPESARRDISGWSRRDVARVALRVALGSFLLVGISILVIAVVVAGLHPAVTEPAEPTVQQAVATKGLVCVVSSEVSYLAAVVSGVDSFETPADTAGELRELGSDALQTAQLGGSGMSAAEFRDLTAVSSDATKLAAAVQSSTPENLAADANRFESDGSALGSDAGC